ncbi:hypothetical protein JCM6882_009310 [Rhodosporidiobolus microsporus]
MSFRVGFVVSMEISACTKRSSSTKGKHITQVNPLAKGLACTVCRARKVRCSGEKPACRACLRTARFEGRDLSQVVCSYEGRAANLGAGGGGKGGKKKKAGGGGGGRQEEKRYAMEGMAAGTSSYALHLPDPYSYTTLQQQQQHSPFLPPPPPPPPAVLPLPNPSSFTPTPPLSYSSSHSPGDSTTALEHSPPLTAVSASSSAPPSVCYDQSCGGCGPQWAPRAPVAGSVSSPHLHLPAPPPPLSSRASGVYLPQKASGPGEYLDSDPAYFDAGGGGGGGPPRYAYTLPPLQQGPSSYSPAPYYPPPPPKRPGSTPYYADHPHHQQQQLSPTLVPSPSYPSYATGPSPSTAGVYYASPPPPPSHPGNVPTPPPASHPVQPVPYLSASETPYTYRSAAPRALPGNGNAADPTFSVPLSARDPPAGGRQALHVAPLPSPGLGMGAYALSSAGTGQTPGGGMGGGMGGPLSASSSARPVAGTPGFADVDSWLRGLAHP